MIVLSASVFLLSACAGGGADSTEMPSTVPTKVGEAMGMNVPESVRYDAELDVWYVSNVNGNPSVKDNNGFIARVRADSVGVMTMLVEGGKNGVTLNAPKGMAIKGDTLFVADIDVVRRFNRRTGAPMGAIAVPRATFLNDVAVGPDGIYVTDSGIRFDAQGNMSQTGTSALYKLSGTVTAVARGDSLTNANGIAWDGANSRWILAPFGGPDVQTIASGATRPTAWLSGPGGYDGVEVLPDGRVLVSSWTDSTVHVITPDHPMLMPLVRNVSAPADIGFDTKRNVLAIPRFNDGKVEFYKLP